MPVYGDKDFLLQLQGALLPTRNEGKNQGGHEIFGTADDIHPSHNGHPACH